jgi:hypothetical protein
LKIGNYRREYFSKKWNHSILGIQDGQEGYVDLKSLLTVILPELKRLEKYGIEYENELYRVEVHFVGDMPFILKMLGISNIKGIVMKIELLHFIGKEWCPKCKLQHINDWDKECVHRTIHTLPSQSLGALHDYWSVDRYHYDPMHCTTAFLKRILGKMVLHAKLIDSKSAIIHRYRILLQHSTYIKYMQNINHKYNRWESISDDEIHNLLHDMNLGKTCNSVTALRRYTTSVIKQTLKQYKEGKKLYDTLPVFDHCTIPGKTYLERLQNLFDMHCISINLSPKNGKSFSVLGKHVEDVFAILNDICTILHWKSTVKDILLKVFRILRIIIDYKPSKEHCEEFICTVKSIAREFCDVLDIKPFHYLHVLVTHMVDDMREYHSVGLFSCASIESFNSVMKKIMTRNTNNHDNIDKNHYLRQTVTRYLLKQRVHQHIMYSKPADSHKQYALATPTNKGKRKQTEELTQYEPSKKRYKVPTVAIEYTYYQALIGSDTPVTSDITQEPLDKLLLQQISNIVNK